MNKDDIKNRLAILKACLGWMGYTSGFLRFEEEIKELNKRT